MSERTTAMLAAIKAAGAHVQGDGSIFFANVEQFRAAAAAVLDPASPIATMERKPIGRVHIDEGHIEFEPADDAWRMGRHFDVFGSAAPAAPAWQPMETAPADGTVLLMMARYIHATAEIPVIAHYSAEHGGWINQTFASVVQLVVPSAWMFRPEPLGAVDRERCGYAATPAAQSAGQEPVAYLHESSGRLLHAQSRELCDNRRREWTALGRVAAPVNDGERDEDGVDLREAAEMAVEAFRLLGGLIGEIRAKGNYSKETTIRFLEEAQMCLYRLHGLIGEPDEAGESTPMRFLKKWRAVIEAMPMGAADAQRVGELREAARQFHNLTQGDPEVIIRPPSAEKRDAIAAAGERLRAALTSPAKLGGDEASHGAICR